MKLLKPYLCLPVRPSPDKAPLTLRFEDGRALSLIMPAGETTAFEAALPLFERVGEEIELEGDFSPEFFDAIRQADVKPRVNDGARPNIHFAPESGWMNDPNGLVCVDGEYRMYFQYNPVDVDWNNMCWGSATSRDLIRWTQGDIVLMPDEHGDVFSGCCVKLRRAALGEDAGALVYYYTAAPRTGRDFTQRAAVSRDGGNALHRLSKGALGTIAPENRDPCVFFYAPHGVYVMALWLEGEQFGLFRSHDLVEWTQTQRFQMQNGFECPILAPIPDEAGGESWLFACADGSYQLGEFDGFLFTPDTPVQRLYATDLPYAAQCFANVSGRTLFMPWLRTPKDTYRTGMMGVPQELTICSSRVRMRFARELRARATQLLCARECAADARVPDGAALLIDIEGTARVIWNGCEIAYEGGYIKCEEAACRAGVNQVELLIDKNILEFHADYGMIYGGMPIRAPMDGGALTVCAGVNSSARVFCVR